MNEILQKILPKGFCPICLDTGIWRGFANNMQSCPDLSHKQSHKEPNEESVILREKYELASKNGRFVSSDEFLVARILTHYSKENPCPKDVLLEVLYQNTNLLPIEKEDKLHQIIENLRTKWCMLPDEAKTDSSKLWVCLLPF